MRIFLILINLLVVAGLISIFMFSPAMAGIIEPPSFDDEFFGDSLDDDNWDPFGDWNFDFSDSSAGGGQDFADLVNLIVNRVINPLTVLFISLALAVFFWGMIKYIRVAGSEEDKKEAKNIMVWGIIALVVMTSVWGIVQILQNSLLSGTDLGAPPVPRIR